MAFLHPIFASWNQPIFYPNKCSAISALKLIPKHANFRCHSKNHFTTSLNQNIHISENGKGRDAIQIRHAKALEEVKIELVSKARQNADRSLSMVDSIQILGMDHLFEEEIETILKTKLLMLRVHNHQGNYDYQDLSQVALQFRLLRQQGYYVHADIFEKFWDDKGKLKVRFYDDINGLIGLFEACQLRIEGEYYLDEAEESSRQYLNRWLCRFHEHPQVKFVEDSLRYPINRSLSKFTPRHSWELEKITSSLQELSKIDTEMVSSLHQKEIFAVSKWWKELGLIKELKFCRDESIKGYMWTMACLPGLRFSEERIELTKPLSLLYIIDDIFDFCASIHELTLFTDVVQRWDMAAMEQLPDYMKGCFKALYDITTEFAFKTQIKHGWNPISTLIKSWVRLLNAFLEEAKWFASGHVPKAEEYLKNGIVSTGVHMILVHSFFFMGQGITKETVTLMDEFPSIISSTATILRLYDDLEGDQDVNGDGNDGSYMKCYMKENPGTCIEEAREHVTQLISNAWKLLNQECLTDANSLPSSFTKICLNAARMVPLMYSSHDTNSPSKLEDYVNGGVMHSVLENY